MTREAELIKKVARIVPSRLVPALRLGIGDDAAVIAPSDRADWVVSCDQFLEGVHFFAEKHPPDSVGYKSLARAASDLAAMGAAPRLFLMTLALPARRSGAWLDRFLAGMAQAARELGMTLIGGDTSESRLVSVGITVLGEVASGKAVRRAGARPGDIILVSGRLGAAQLGLELVKRSGPAELKRILRSQSCLLQPHLYPKIRAELGAWLGRQRTPSAMIDISDGLSTDLARLCAASGVGARIWPERIPCVALPGSDRGATAGTLARRIRNLDLDPLEMALNGGDDYELLFTVPPGRTKRLRRAPGFRDLVSIGEIERGKGITLVGADGRARRLIPAGWDSFLP